MNKKPASTITPKPEVPSTIESWISGAVQSAESPQAVMPSSMPAVQPASQPASMEATKMLSVRIPAHLHQRLRIHSVSENLQIQDIVTELLNRYLDEPKN